MKRCGPAAVLLLAAVSVSCGKSGPPLPPLVRNPAPPGDVTAERRGAAVDVTMTVPSANTDGTKPANIDRVDLYAITAPAAVTDDQLVKSATKVGSVDVKAPRDPNAAVQPDDPASDAELPGGKGLDQGASAKITEHLSAASLKPADLAAPARPSRQVSIPRPLTGPPAAPPIRVYAGVGVTPRGRRGPFSRRAVIPLVAAPAAPEEPSITYDETAIVVSWQPASLTPPVQEPAAGGVLPARLFGLTFPATGYNVYEVKDATETRLTKAPLAEPRYADTRVEWGVERCYLVRVAETFTAMSIESDASPPVCETPIDTFPPGAPTGLQSVPSEGSINLIWTPGTDKDLAGYLVLRGAAPSGPLTPVTAAPIQEPQFIDKVPSGVRFVYAVQAVDKSGNVSAESPRVEEAAR